MPWARVFTRLAVACALVAGTDAGMADKNKVILHLSDGRKQVFKPNNASEMLYTLINETYALQLELEYNLNWTETLETRQEKSFEDVGSIRNRSGIALDHASEFVETEEYFKILFNTLTLSLGGVFLFIGRWGFLARGVGMVTPKNIKLTIMVDFVALATSIFFWWAIGHALAFGEDDYPDTGNNGFVGTTGMFSRFGHEFNNKNLYMFGEYLLYMGQCTWCASIAVGTTHERMTLVSTLISTAVLAMLAFPMMAHTVWDENGRFASNRNDRLEFGCGTIDHLGGAVVHMTAGLCALSAEVIVGPRTGRWKQEDGNTRPVLQPKTQTSLAYEAIGTMLIFITACGVSMFSANDFEEQFAVSIHTIGNTAIIAGTASLTAVAVGYFFTGVLSPQLANGGLVAGIAAAASPARVVSFEASLVIGYIAGWAYNLGGMVLLKLRIDDTAHTIAMHLFGGGWGVLATGMFATPNLYSLAVSDTRYHTCSGLFYRGGVQLLLAQCLLASWCIFLVGSLFTFLFAVMHGMGLSRFPVLEEIMGIDAYRFGGAMSFVKSASDLETKKQALSAYHIDKHGRKIAVETTRKV